MTDDQKVNLLKLDFVNLVALLNNYSKEANLDFIKEQPLANFLAFYKNLSKQQLLSFNEAIPQQELLDYLNSLLLGYDADIANDQLMITSIDTTITNLEANIAALEAQKVDVTANIATCNLDKTYVDELIIIVTAL